MTNLLGPLSQTSCGLMVDHSLLLFNSHSLHNSGDSCRRHPHRTTLKVMGRSNPQLKSMKKIICTSWNGRSLHQDKFCRALLQYRNTPSRRDGLSLAQKLYGHLTQDTLSAHRRSFSQEWQQKMEEVER